MTRDSAHLEMSRVEDNLTRALALLSSMEHGARDCSQILEHTAGSLRSLERDYQLNAGEFPALLPSFLRAQRKAYLVEQLLYSAACYYSGWLTAGETAGACYLPSAEQEHRAKRGALSIEA